VSEFFHVRGINLCGNGGKATAASITEPTIVA